MLNEYMGNSKEALCDLYLLFIWLSVCRMWSEELERTSGISEKPSLFKVLAKCFGPKAVLLGLIVATLEIIFRWVYTLIFVAVVRSIKYALIFNNHLVSKAQQIWLLGEEGIEAKE